MSENSESLQQYVQLMTQHQGALRAFIVSLMPGNPDVGDVLQETNLVLWQKREQFEKGSKFLAWAFTIARYQVMQQRDKAKRDGRLVFCDELMHSLSEPDTEDHDDEQQLRALEHCMNRLRAAERELIRHRYTKGCSLEDLAQHQSKSAGALRASLFRVRAALKKCVDRQLVEGDPA
ncbi:sigma-70 family RNA polymerase sigma factor [Verrucomicrobiaceae bacterium N1E253]|uniref:Sigma-70 family RNA polymerase sigma factor n=1 Tax=Oceaniferula marina TaxID=2748318 RepID=A0A851GLS1_9BACT|nr:sigma-70 family RNA polymerase sigma factor [Oceaniferula marina]NWK55084.1 sigma-70 family RNA polymerase sigma factor [Oceaniferula marina]